MIVIVLAEQLLILVVARPKAESRIMNQELRKKQQRSQGFTLIELIIYLSLVSVFISGAVLFAWDIIYGRVKSQTQQEVNQNLRLASKRITYQIRNASEINFLGGSILSLAAIDSFRDPTIFDLSAGRLRIGFGSSGPCPVASPCNLTSNEVTVSNLVFTDLSSGSNSKNIQFTITIASTADRSEWQKSQTYTTSVELRSN